MKQGEVMRDERTIAVENASYRWAYLVLSYGLLLSIIYRSFVLHEQSWDLLALVVLGGGVTSLQQGAQGVLTRRWWLLSITALVAALVLAALTLLYRR